jgi:WD40 repeat protein
MRGVVALLPLLLIAAAPPASGPSIPALVKQLGADTYAERDGASKALDKIGPPALRELRQAMLSADLEVRLRAKRVVDAIEARIYGERRVFDAEAGSVNGVAFSPDGKRAAAATSRGVRLWDVATGKLLAANDEHRDRVMAVAFSPDGKLLASASEDKTVRLWDAASLAELRVLRGHKDAVRGVAFTGDGKHLLSAGFDGLIQEWDVAAGAPQREATVLHGRFYGVAPLSGSSRVLASLRHNNEVYVLELGRQGGLLKLEGHKNQVLSFSLSRDAKRMLSGSQDMTLRLWDVETRKCLQTLKGHTAEVCAVALSPDGKRAVSGGHDKVLRLWDLTTGQHIREFRGHDQVIWCVAFSPDGKHALSGSHDGTVRLWAVGY